MYPQGPVGNAGFIRNMNAAEIFRLIASYGPISRKALANNTRFSAATITNHVKVLLAENFVVEVRKEESTGGRKPVQLEVNPDRGFFLAVEFDISQVRLWLFNLRRQAVKKAVVPFFRGQKPDEVLSAAVMGAENILAEQGIFKTALCGVGLGMPGQVSPAGELIFAPNLGWQRTAVAAPFAETFDSSVLVVNEAWAGAFAEWEGGYSSTRNFAFVSVKEGIGCGLIFDGQLFQGAQGRAGEFGHIPLNPQGPRCHCGSRGCWETLASEAALLRRARTIKPDISSLADLTAAARCHLDPVYAEVGHWLGVGAACVANAVNPEVLVIGGSIVRYAPVIAAAAEASFDRQVLPGSRWKSMLRFSSSGDDATLWGLGGLLFQRCLPALLNHEQ